MSISWNLIRLIILFVSCHASEKESTLLQLHVIFRHGDRTPDLLTMYPKDPHLNDTWDPDGLGELTKLGKMQEYKIGQNLRQTYDNFLGKLYTPDIIDSWSTNFSRTKMSLELVLAGLWPCDPSQIWNDLLPWQPIPYNFLPMENDTLLRIPVVMHCPKYKIEHDKILSRKEFKGWIKDNENIIKYINENSGLQIKSLLDIYKLYFGMYAEEHTGRVLPEWTKKVYPEFLARGTILNYKSQVFSEFLKQKTGGGLVKKIINDAKDKIYGSLKPKDRKLFIYSGHEFNIVYLQVALNTYKPHIPPYASYMVIELHKIDDVYGFKILYQDYEQNQPKVLTIPQCELFCPLDEFIKLTANVIPQDDTC